MDVNNNCAARKVGMPDISTATPSWRKLSTIARMFNKGLSLHSYIQSLVSKSFYSVSLNVSPSRNKPNNISASSTPSSKSTLLRGTYDDINLTSEHRYRKSSMVDSKLSAICSRSFGLSNYNDLEDKWAQDTGNLPSLSTTHNPALLSHRCVNNGMTVMQDGSIQCVVNKGRCKSMKSEPVSPSVTRSFAFDPFPKSASSENTLYGITMRHGLLHPTLLYLFSLYLMNTRRMMKLNLISY